MSNKNEYNYREIRNQVYSLVKKANYSQKNFYGDTTWEFHILPVVRHSLLLGKKLIADLEVLELASLLHDFAAIADKKYIKEHHVHGAKLAEKILHELSYSEEKIIKIKNCILNHRASRKDQRKTLEEKILASADAMSHFSELADMMYLTYGIHKFKTAEGAKWLKAKLSRSWQKIMPAGKEIIKKDYLVAMSILDKAIKD